MDPTNPRARTAIAPGERKLLALLALFCLGLGLVWTTDSLTTVERTQEVRHRTDWTESGAFRYEVPIERDTPRNRSGEVLGMGEPGYFTTISPRFHVTFRWLVDDARGSITPAQARLEAVALTAHGEPWTAELDRAKGSLDANGVLDLSATLDLPALDARYREDRGDAAEKPAWLVRAEVVSRRDYESGPTTSRYELPIRYDAPLYVLPPPSALSSTKDHGESEVATHETRVGPETLLRSPAGPATIVAGLVGLAIAWRSTHAQPEEETP